MQPARWQGAEQVFTPPANVMHELKEAQIQQQFLLRDTAMGWRLGTEQRPKAFLHVPMNRMEAIAVLVTRVFAPAMTHGMMIKSPIFQGGRSCIHRYEHAIPAQ